MGHDRYEIREVGPADPLHRSCLAHVLCRPSASTPEVDASIARLERLVQRQRLKMDLLVAAVTGETVCAAVLAVEAPGGTAMIYLPPGVAEASVPTDAVADVLAGVADGAARQGLVFLQALLNTEEASTARLLSGCKYTFLAELVYMDAVVPPVAAVARNVPGIRFSTYDPTRRAVFLEALQLSYVDSQDCPGLAHLRTMDAILEGHAAAGHFDPQGWWLAEDDAGPAGVLLMAQVPDVSACEIVYLGVSPRLRGKGVSAALMNRGFGFARERRLSTLSLAVDSINVPARRLYERWGFQPVARRRAWINILRPRVS